MPIKAIIIDDERLARTELKKLLQEFSDIEVVDEAANVDEGVEKIETQNPDLIFLDIQMPGKTGFDLLGELDKAPHVIFTTAYDEYALKAFKVNSIDYLLKPVQKEELKNALNKYKKMKDTYTPKSEENKDMSLDSLVKELQRKLQPKEFRKRFLVKHAQKLVSIEIDEIAYFFSDGRLNFFKTTDNRKFVVDYTMDELEDMLDPEQYFRISRSFYVSVGSIDKIDDYFGNRLILQLKPAVDKEALVSREKVTDFKKWMGK